MNLFFMTAVAFAQQTGGAPPATSPAPTGFFPPPIMLSMIAILVLFYFMLWRPQRAEQRKREELLSSVGKGDQVLTTGGILGTVESVDTAKGVVTVNVAPKVSLKFSRAAITTITKKKEGGKDEAESGAA